MQSQYPLNSMPITSRDLSFSGGGSAIKSEQISLNPASIVATEKGLNFHTQLLPTGISLLSLHMIYPKNEIIYFTSISNLNFGTLKDGITNEIFYANDLMINGGLKGNLFQIISGGASLSYTLSIIEKSMAQSLLFSAGVRTEITEKQIGFGLTLRNLGFQIDHYEDATEEILYQFQLSGFMKPKHLPALIFSDIVMEENIDGSTLITGMEFYPRDGLILRFSDSGLYNNGFELSSLAFGFQFNLKNWTIDLASRNLISAGFVNGVTFRKRF
ncbi:MAG: hypothetical protein HOM61_00015 [Candidatus Marinimicrobia bacterium]|nr:hypothetical protein [Candidatus Neomarinimicrobiota bacterium]